MHIDFETFSGAGYRWDPERARWCALEGNKKTGIGVVGAESYALHPSTRVLCLAYDDNLWRPGDPNPPPLWEHVESGKIVHAWNSAFEYWIWKACLEPQGWPKLRIKQLRDGAPRARAWALPGSLGAAAKVMGSEQKDNSGKSLIKKLCCPRQPTKHDKRLRITREDDPESFAALDSYCLQDVVAETGLDSGLPPLSPFELEVWLLDQEINARGIPVDVKAVENACELLRQAERVLNAELQRVTGGAVETVGQIAKLQEWCHANGTFIPDCTAPRIKDYLATQDLTPAVRRALEIRQALGSASVKKVWAFLSRLCPDGRVRGAFKYCVAGTGRWAGGGIQPQNFPRPEYPVCVSGDGIYSQIGEPAKWHEDTTDQFIDSMKCRDYFTLSERWRDPLKALASALRGFIAAPPGYDLIGSDFTAIEAVVLAVLAGEQWRIDVFNGHGMIYETSAAKVTGRTLAEYAAYKEEHDSHHPDRALGKLAELASGYGGSVGAWKNFGADKFFTPDRCEEYRAQWEKYRRRDTTTLQDFAILNQVWAWRKASPNIKAFWNGLEMAAMAAVKDPGTVHRYRDIRYHIYNGTLYCTLPSGRMLAYHQARIGAGKFGQVVYFMASNTNPKAGPIGWTELNTYGGKLCENVVQAVARDILAHAMVLVKEAGYSIVMHIHDEVICEERHGFGSVEELERIMGTMPSWAEGWPVRAAGGWRGRRFRK